MHTFHLTGEFLYIFLCISAWLHGVTCHKTTASSVLLLLSSAAKGVGQLPQVPSLAASLHSSSPAPPPRCWCMYSCALNDTNVAERQNRPCHRQTCAFIRALSTAWILRGWATHMWLCVLWIHCMGNHPAQHGSCWATRPQNISGVQSN